MSPLSWHHTLRPIKLPQGAPVLESHPTPQPREHPGLPLCPAQAGPLRPHMLCRCRLRCGAGIALAASAGLSPLLPRVLLRLAGGGARKGAEVLAGGALPGASLVGRLQAQGKQGGAVCKSRGGRQGQVERGAAGAGSHHRRHYRPCISLGVPRPDGRPALWPLPPRQQPQGPAAGAAACLSYGMSPDQQRQGGDPRARPRCLSWRRRPLGFLAGCPQRAQHP